MMTQHIIHEIQWKYDRLVKMISNIDPSNRTTKMIDGTGGKISVADLIAYQIGWGNCLVRWYETGVKGEVPEMPGDGFSSWNYTAIAKHFYEKYCYDSSDQQMKMFHQTYSRILRITEIEYKTGNLDQI